MHDISIISRIYSEYRPSKVIIDNDGVINPQDLRTVLRNSGIASIEISSGNPYYLTHDGIVYNRDRTYLFGCPSGRTGKVVIPDGVKEINESAFDGCKITDVVIPDSVTSIGANAFVFSRDCDYDTEVVLPSSLRKLNNHSFYGVNHIVVSTDNGMLPQGLFNAIGAGNNSVKKISTKLTVDGKDYLIPFAGGRLSKWDEYFKMIPFDEDIIWNFYQDIDDREPELIRKFLIELYPTIDNPKVKTEIGKKLRSFQRSIFKMCLSNTDAFGNKINDNSNDQLLLKYLSYNLCTENALKTLANDANKLGEVNINAYALQAISNLNNSKKTFFKLQTHNSPAASLPGFFFFFLFFFLPLFSLSGFRRLHLLPDMPLHLPSEYFLRYFFSQFFLSSLRYFSFSFSASFFIYVYNIQKIQKKSAPQKSAWEPGANAKF